MDPLRCKYQDEIPSLCRGWGGRCGRLEKEMLVDPWEGEKEGRRKVFPRPKLPVGGALHLPGTGLS